MEGQGRKNEPVVAEEEGGIVYWGEKKKLFLDGRRTSLLREYPEIGVGGHAMVDCKSVEQCEDGPRKVWDNARVDSEGQGQCEGGRCTVPE